MLLEQRAVDPGADPHRSRRIAVEPGVEPEVGARVVDVAAQAPAAVDAHRAGRLDAHRPPETTRIPRRVHRVPVLEHAGDDPLRLPVPLRRAGHLDGQHVLGRQARQIGDVEAVREEVPLRIAEVGTVQPHVGLVEHTVQRDEMTLAPRWGLEIESLAVDQRVVVVGERFEVAPVARDLDLRPVVVEVVETDGAAPALVVGDIGTPESRQIHDGETRRGSAPGVWRRKAVWSTHGNTRSNARRSEGRRVGNRLR